MKPEDREHLAVVLESLAARVRAGDVIEGFYECTPEWSSVPFDPEVPRRLVRVGYVIKMIATPARTDVQP